MKLARTAVTVVLLLLCSSFLRAECISIDKAAKRIGEIVCVRGRVLKVSATARGTQFLDFCDDYRNCPFTVVVFERDLRDIGDIRLLSGQEVEIDGTIKLYRGRPEIILSSNKQLRGRFSRLPPIPKDYDVARRGNFSAGTFSGPHKLKAPKKPPRDNRDPEFEPGSQANDR